MGTGYWGELKKGTGYWGKSKIRNDENTGIFKPGIPIIPKIPRGKRQKVKRTKLYVVEILKNIHFFTGPSLDHVLFVIQFSHQSILTKVNFWWLFLYYFNIKIHFFIKKFAYIVGK